MRPTAAQCRTISPKLHPMSDEEVLEIRDALYLLAELALDAAVEEIGVPNNRVGIHDSTQKNDNNQVWQKSV
jgi:hypothetical protein